MARLNLSSTVRVERGKSTRKKVHLKRDPIISPGRFQTFTWPIVSEEEYNSYYCYGGGTILLLESRNASVVLSSHASIATIHATKLVNASNSQPMHTETKRLISFFSLQFKSRDEKNVDLVPKRIYSYLYPCWQRV